MPGPSPSQKAQPQSTQAVSKIPMNLPAGLSISLKPMQRNNQQQQQRQQPVARASQIQTAIIRVQSPSTVVENTAPKNIASATAPIDHIDQNVQNDEIGDLPIDMDIDETIGKGKTNDKDIGLQELDNGGNENMSKLSDDTEHDGYEDAVKEINNDGKNQDQSDDEFNGFDFQGDDYGTSDDNNNNKSAEYRDMENVLQHLENNEAK